MVYAVGLPVVHAVGLPVVVAPAIVESVSVMSVLVCFQYHFIISQIVEFLENKFETV